MYDIVILDVVLYSCFTNNMIAILQILQIKHKRRRTQTYTEDKLQIDKSFK
jgi:hypothetical protein